MSVQAMTKVPPTIKLAQAGVSAKDAVEYENKMYPDSRATNREPDDYGHDIVEEIKKWVAEGRPTYEQFIQKLNSR